MSLADSFFKRRCQLGQLQFSFRFHPPGSVSPVMRVPFLFNVPVNTAFPIQGNHLRFGVENTLGFVALIRSQTSGQRRIAGCGRSYRHYTVHPFSIHRQAAGPLGKKCQPTATSTARTMSAAAATRMFRTVERLIWMNCPAGTGDADGTNDGLPAGWALDLRPGITRIALDILPAFRAGKLIFCHGRVRFSHLRYRRSSLVQGF